MQSWLDSWVVGSSWSKWKDKPVTDVSPGISSLLFSLIILTSKAESNLINSAVAQSWESKMAYFRTGFEFKLWQIRGKDQRVSWHSVEERKKVGVQRNYQQQTNKWCPYTRGKKYWNTVTFEKQEFCSRMF